MTDSSLSARVAVVTGAAGGMGRAICQTLTDAGVHVFATDLADDPGDLAVAHFTKADVSDADAIAAVVQTAVEGHGRLDCAVNAAAIEFEMVPLADCSDDDYDQMMRVNVRGVFLAMKHEIRAMMAAGNGGSIVNIASTNSYRPQHKQPAYTASKHAVAGLTKSAAIDYARHNIRVNAICPGAIDTPMLHNAMERRGRKADEVAGRLSYLGRFGAPDEIAKAALWLCSDAASFTTGHMLAVDGGMLAG